jgi:hypothetical protein
VKIGFDARLPGFLGLFIQYWVLCLPVFIVGIRFQRFGLN